MQKFLRKPNLPESGVTLCALASGNSMIVDKLLKMGVKVIEVVAHPTLAEPVCRHADLQLYSPGGGECLLAPGCEELRIALLKQKFSVKEISLTLNSTYPQDIALCCFALGKALYCHPAHTAPEIRALYSHIRPVRQGYARCSTCIVEEGCIITADLGIAAVAEADGVEVLRITPGHIALPGYPHGFIGGCCGLLSPDLLAFTGKIDTHPDNSRIRAFCRERGVDILCLTDGPLVDIGGILPLLEE